MAQPAFTTSAGTPNCGQSVASSIATRWPPAEWPDTVMRAGSPPNDRALACTHATEARTWRTSSSRSTVGTSA